MKLCQVLALEKDIKGKAYSVLTDMNKLAQKPALFNGMNRKYQPTTEGGEQLPPETQRVQITAKSVIETVSRAMMSLFDVTAQKDYANLSATADVTADGHVLVKNAPVTYLLFLEKQLTDLRTFVSNLPILDTSEDWHYNDQTDQFYTAPTTTVRTKKEARPIVLYPATDVHPAQTQLITEDVAVGRWNVVKVSGALPLSTKTAMLERVDRLTRAVKSAREAANATATVNEFSTAPVFDYLFGQTDD